MSDSYDVIVIGSGAGGGTLVHRLAPSGKRILLLERGDWLPREPQNWLAQDVFVDNRYVSPETWYDAGWQALPAAGALLRRRRDEALRRRALPAAREGLRRAAPPRRRLAGVADLLRRAGALLHPGRAALPGARCPRRGPDRATGQRAVSLPGRLPRAPHPAALRRPRGRRATTPSTPPAGSCSTRATCPTAAACGARLRRLPVPGPRQVRRRGGGGAAGDRAPERHPAHEREGRRGSTRTTRAPPSPRSSSSATARPRAFAGDIVVVSCGAANSAKLLQLSASDKHPNGLANGSDQVGRNFMFHDSTAVLALSKEENPTIFQKTLGLNDFYFAGEEFDYPLGNIQMVGKSQAPMFRGEKPRRDEAGARVDAGADRPPRGRLLALHRGPAAPGQPRPRGPRRQADAELHGDQRRRRGSGCTTSSGRCSATWACTRTTCSPSTPT